MVFTFSYKVYAQKALHQETLYEIANQTSSNEISSIEVGKTYPTAIGVNTDTNIIYVSNRDGNTLFQ